MSQHRTEQCEIEFSEFRNVFTPSANDTLAYYAELAAFAVKSAKLV